jgi:hypothetical protein
MTYHRICNKNNTTGATSGEGTAYIFRAPELISGLSGVRLAQSYAWCFTDHCLSPLPFSFGHRTFCPFSI